MASSVPRLTEGPREPLGAAWSPLAPLHPAGVRVGLPAEDQDGMGSAPNSHPVLPGQLPWVSLPLSPPSPGKYPKWNPSLQCDHIGLNTCFLHLVSILHSCVDVRGSQVDEVRTQKLVSAVQPDPPPATAEGSQRGTVGWAAQGTPWDPAC